MSWYFATGQRFFQENFCLDFDQKLLEQLQYYFIHYYTFSLYITKIKSLQNLKGWTVLPICEPQELQYQSAWQGVPTVTSW